MDSDMRRPVLNKIFRVPGDHGLSSAVLRPNPGVHDHLRSTDVENLRVLPSGVLPPNPAELLGSKRMRTIVEELKREAEVVLFDSPPLLAVTDAAVLSTLVDGVLMVCQAGGTRRDEVVRGVEELRRVRGNLLGIVLNGLSARNGYYYYDYKTKKDDGRHRRRSWRRRLQRLLPFWTPSTKRTEKEYSTGELSVPSQLSRAQADRDGGGGS